MAWQLSPWPQKLAVSPAYLSRTESRTWAKTGRRIFPRTSLSGLCQLAKPCVPKMLHLSKTASATAESQVWECFTSKPQLPRSPSLQEPSGHHPLPQLVEWRIWVCKLDCTADGFSTFLKHSNTERQSHVYRRWGETGCMRISALVGI